MTKVLVICFFLFIGKTSQACSCYWSEYFDLSHYDVVDNVFEVTIDSVYMPQTDTVNQKAWKRRLKYNYIDATVIVVYKGEMKPENIRMKLTESTNCFWKPTVGATYLIYENSIDSISICNRKLRRDLDYEKYQSEVAMLEKLNDKPDTLRLMLNGQILVEGFYEDDKRTGIWMVYSLEKVPKIIYKLSYQNDILLKFEKGPGFDNYIDFHRMSYLYYDHLMKE